MSFELKPYYKNYIKSPDGFKRYMVDSVLYLREQGIAAAVAFDLDNFIANVPETIEPDQVYTSDSMGEAGRKAVRDLLQDMGFHVFADMMGDMGMDNDTIQLLLSGEILESKAPTGKQIPGFNDANAKVAAEEQAQGLYKATLEVLEEIIKDSLSHNNPALLQAVITSMKMTILRKGGNASDETQAIMQELMETTQVFSELVDDNRTTVEEYESFQNKLINFFISDEIEETNTNARLEHESHDPAECEFMLRSKGKPPLQVLYRRIHAMDGTNGNKSDAIPNLSLIVLDTVRGQITPIAFSLHEAMSETTADTFQAACRSESGMNFIMGLLVEFRKQDTERFDEIVGAKRITNDGEDMLAMSIAVKPEIITPQSATMVKILQEVRETFDVDAEEVFADINPDDFN